MSPICPGFQTSPANVSQLSAKSLVQLTSSLAPYCILLHRIFCLNYARTGRISHGALSLFPDIFAAEESGVPGPHRPWRQICRVVSRARRSWRQSRGGLTPLCTEALGEAQWTAGVLIWPHWRLAVRNSELGGEINCKYTVNVTSR